MLILEQGPCGEEWDDEYDGDMTSKPLWGFPNADGISVACADTVIERNVSFRASHLLQPGYRLSLSMI